jgi:16S rRNA (cytosine967-C5)-methyltransferase
VPGDEQNRKPEEEPVRKEVLALPLATRVVGGVDREHPADSVLRVVLKEEAGLRRETAGEVARFVFSYFRWRGFVGRGLPLPRQIESAADLARRYALDPDSVAPQGWDRAVPAWVRDRVAGGAEWWKALQKEPQLWLRARPGTAESVKMALGEVIQPLPEVAPDALVYQGPKDLFREPGFQAGTYEIQDLASQMVGQLCAPLPGETWWDACAGEGGKTLHLADLMGNRGVVWATDRAGWRLQRLRVRAGRANLFNIRWAEWEGGESRPGKTMFDGVLIDAPCSGLGTWQRNPHARWTMLPEDVTELSALQIRLLKNAAAGVKVGGRIVFSVCTLTHEETVKVSDAFEAAMPGFEPLALPDSHRRGPGAKSESRAKNRLWIWPQDWGGNGMYVAAWIRRK